MKKSSSIQVKAERKKPELKVKKNTAKKSGMNAGICGGVNNPCCC